MRWCSPPLSPTSTRRAPGKRKPRSSRPGACCVRSANRSGVLSRGVDRLLGRGLVAADLVVLRLPLRSADVDLLGLHRFGDLADELDREQPVFQIRALDLDMVGEREAPLERAVGDSAIDEVAVLL